MNAILDECLTPAPFVRVTMDDAAGDLHLLMRDTDDMTEEDWASVMQLALNGDAEGLRHFVTELRIPGAVLDGVDWARLAWLLEG